MKIEILHVIDCSLRQGVSVRRSCLILAIEHRRVVRWKLRARLGQSLASQKPGPKLALHRMLPEEIQRIVSMAQSQKYVDLSHRMMAVTAWDQDLFQASFTTVYRVLKGHGMMSRRGPGGAHNGRSKPPIRKVLCAPNQRWCWDISYLLTQQKGTYLFLYLLLDEWSRKVIQWRISWSQSTEEARLLLEGGLIEQSILDQAEDQRPEVINDRGRQMKAKSIQKLCEDHAMPQLFSRPRTPNDNPFIESAFSTLKRAPDYPGRFLDDAEALTYFTRYFAWYDTEHYHSGIDYVTPQQAHSGLRVQIVKERRAKMISQRRLRRAENTRRNPTTENTNEPNKMTVNLVA